MSKNQNCAAVSAIPSIQSKYLDKFVVAFSARITVAPSCGWVLLNCSNLFFVRWTNSSSAEIVFYRIVLLNLTFFNLLKFSVFLLPLRVLDVIVWCFVLLQSSAIWIYSCDLVWCKRKRFFWMGNVIVCKFVLEKIKIKIMENSMEIFT